MKHTAETMNDLLDRGTGFAAAAVLAAYAVSLILLSGGVVSIM
jgi:hypothetical protein